MNFISILSSTVKSIVGTVAFFIALGWSAFVAVNLVVKAEGQEIRKDVMSIREIDMKHMDNRFDRIESLLKDKR